MSQAEKLASQSPQTGRDERSSEKTLLRWRKRNSYYYGWLDRIYRFVVRPGSRVLHVGCECGDLLAAVNLAKGHGLKVSLYIMVGIIGETLADFEETIEITRACLPNYYEIFIFYPYPGTELYQQARQKGLLEQALSDDKERSRAVLNLPGFTKKQILAKYIWFEYYIYKGQKSLIRILATVLRNKIYTSPKLYKLSNKLISNRVIYRWVVKTKNVLIGRKV